MRGAYRKRRVHQPPKFNRFKPAGIPAYKLETVTLSVDEYEAIRLTDYLQLDHLASSERMSISRPTFTRLIESARNKVARAMVDGKQLLIHGGNFDFEQITHRCRKCGDTQNTRPRFRIQECLRCGSEEVSDLSSSYIQIKVRKQKKSE